MPRPFCQLSLFIVCVTLLACGNRQGDDHDLVELTMQGKQISIEYDRLFMNEHDLLANAPAGFISRLGKSAILTTEADLAFGLRTVPQGTYSLWTQHGTGQHWWLIINRRVEGAGAPLDERNSVVVIPFTYSKSTQSVERLTITLTSSGDEGRLTVRWGLHRLEATFTLLSVTLQKARKNSGLVFASP